MLSNVDFKSVEELIKAVDNSKVGYLQVNFKDVSIIMKKEGESGLIESQPVPVQHNLDQSKSETISVKEAADEKKEDKEDKENEIEAEVKNENKVEDKNLKEITAPIVGTFYSSSGPDKEPFVSVGSKVKKGDTLCILEAMKLMNEIQSDVDGEVVEILVENAEMVEYGQPMFKIKTA